MTQGSTTAGVVYDVAELDRIKGWINQQDEAFQNYESNTKQKEWLIIGGATVLVAVISLIVLKTVAK